MPTVLITGATSGIGRACALRCAALHYNLIITGRRPARLQELTTQLTQEYQIKALPLCFDVADQKQVAAAFTQLKNTPDFLPVDVLINNAGNAYGLDPIQDADLADLEKMININVLGMIYVTKAAIPLMQKSPRPHIIHLGSIAGKEPYPKGHVYCASKAAVDAFTKGIRQDLLPLGFKVSAIHPGMVNTEFSTVRFHGDKAKADQTYHGLTPLTADDIADTITFMITRPDHVNIAEVVIFPKAQANATVSFRQD